MSDVRPRKGGPYSLYCYDCGEWVPNTANAEMAKEGCYAHSHWCKKPDPCATSEITWHVAEEIAEARAEGARQERERVRAAVEKLQALYQLTYSTTNPADNGKLVACEQILALLQPNTVTQPEILVFDNPDEGACD